LLAAGSAGSGVEVAYYVIASVIALGGVFFGAVKLLFWLKRRWTQEGEQRAESSRVIEANTKAAQANTDAISHLTEKFDGFASSVQGQLNGHDSRITRLEIQQGIGPNSGRVP
jgi:hypothetical protein